MLSSDEGEGGLFFDSVDYLESGCDKLEYDIWLNEPRSVEERRQGFLRGMGLDGVVSKRHRNIRVERINECSGAVSSSSVSWTYVEEVNLVSCSAGRGENSQANCMVDEMSKGQMDEPDVASENENIGPPLDLQGCKKCEEEKSKKFDSGKREMKSWWKLFLKKRKEERGGRCLSGVSKLDAEAPKTNRTKVKQNKKDCVEFTGVYMGQEIQAHKGFIWTMKFSPDGQYLATGGEDKVIRIWCVTLADSSCKSFLSEKHSDSNQKEGKSNTLSRKKRIYSSVVIPEKVFQIEEAPLQEFHGHASDILDLAWSDSNHLLSSSMDKTVRLWRLGCHHSLNIFRHSNYVTCIQFNPVDKNYFISGSIDGKVRIWGVSEKRVVHWTDLRDVISAICYQPDGRGFVVGTTKGTCRFYEVSGTDLQLEAEIRIGRKRPTGNRITGIQFSQEICPRVMITSEDSKVRVFDGVDIVNKFKGLPKSGSQMSASFTSNGRHIISVGEDCRVYVWNYDGLCTPWSKHIKSVRSCEHFFSEGVSVAVPWSGAETEVRGLSSSSSNVQSHAQTEENASWRKDSERFSLGSWLFMDGRCRGSSATWPEEKLPKWDVPVLDAEYQNQQIENLHQHQYINTNDHISSSEAWGLVIVTAGWDGKIKTFHNYGLPIMLK